MQLHADEINRSGGRRPTSLLALAGELPDVGPTSLRDRLLTMVRPTQQC